MENRENSRNYTELKEYKQELKERITQLKEERNDKAAYLVSLDKEYAELEVRYNKLLEERKRISEKLENINIGKSY